MILIPMFNLTITFSPIYKGMKIVINKTNGITIFNLESILIIFNRRTKSEITVIINMVIIRYTSSITKKGITSINGKIKRITGLILFKYRLSCSCLNGSVGFKSSSAVIPS